MYKPGAIACLLVVLLVGACGCSLAASGSGPASGGAAQETPTLPTTYIAGEATPLPANTPATPTPVPTNATSVNIMGAQTNVTLTEVTIACTGQSCSNGVTYSNTTSSGSGSGTVTTPTSSISGNVTMAYVKQNPNVWVQFTENAVNTPPYSWMWSWRPAGNLTYESDPSIVLVFSQYGTYKVTRTVSNSAGSASSSANVSVCPLVASFTVNQTTGPAPLAVRFTDTSSDQPGSWAWNFGDGGSSSLQNPVHTYTTAGTYTARLDAANNLGSCWNTTGITVSSLAASFTANQSSGLAPLAIQFTDTSTDQPNAWTWNFGDGSSSTLQNPMHTYTTAGVYTANLNATNGYNGWISAPSKSITVYTLPTVAFSASPLAGTAGTSVLFSDQSSGYPAPSSWYWDFGDGFTSAYQNPSHQYANTGSYTVSHAATNSQGTVWLNKTAYITIS